MTMKKLALLFALLFASSAYAADNAVIVTPGTGVTMKSKDIGGGVQAMQPILSDGSGSALATPTAGADAASNTATGLQSYARPSWFNGTTWDRALGDATNGAFVNVKTSVLPTGAATAANQATEISSLATIATNTGAAIPAGTNLMGDVNVRQGGTTLSITNPIFNRDVATATGGASTAGAAVPNNTTAVVVKASAGTLYGVQLAGIGSAPSYLKIYNATSATCGSGTPVKRLMIPAASTAANGAGSNVSFGATGVDFGTGITYCVTTGIGDSDATAPAASTFLVNVDYK